MDSLFESESEQEDECSLTLSNLQQHDLCSSQFRTPSRQNTAYTADTSASSAQCTVLSSLSACTSVARSMNRNSSLLSREYMRLTKKRKYVSRKRSLDMKSEDRVRDVKRRKALSPEDICASKMSSCCNQGCMRLITLELFTQWREQFIPLSQSRLNTLVMQTIHQGRQQPKVDKKYFYPLPSGWRACSVTVCKVYGISIRHFGELAQQVRKGADESFRSCRAKTNGWKHIFVPWVMEYADKFGNQMPDSNVIEISVGNKFQIYQKFKFFIDEMTSKGIELPSETMSRSWFYKLWSTHLDSTVKVPKSNKFSKCDICCKFKERLSNSGVPFSKRARWMAEFDEHLEMQMKERCEYYRRRSLARSDPHEAWCLMVDGMAQFITNLPSFSTYKPKALFGKKTYDLHVMGVMFHGSPCPYVFVHDSSVPTGPNNTIQCIWNAILDRSRTTRLPPTLFIQLDNTASDNKNHHVLEFCAWLVEEGYFKEVRSHVKYFRTSTHTSSGQAWFHDGRPYSR